MLYDVLCFSAAGLILAALALQRRSVRLRSIARGLLISYFFLLFIFGAGEIFFRFFYAESENVFTQASLNWMARYWQTNSLDYRDREWTPADYAGKKTVLLTGDSFAAGWGINNPADRFGDVLAAHLGSDYAVINLGVYGTATPEQLAKLKAYPLKTPDVVIMQYFLNDIDYTLLQKGLLPDPEPEPAWVKGSALMDFLYVRLLSKFLDPKFNQDWWSVNYDAYDNYVLWDAHKQEIEDYIDYVESVHARLIVVIFPNMLDPVRSIPYVDRVAQVFQARGHNDILKLFDQAAAWSPQDRMVSPRDTHPSVAFHHLVGDLLYQQFFATP
ncbi:MAG: SGNH/GDSL hydrolase family protein [Chloroflexota bacterium]